MNNVFCLGELLLRLSPELGGKWIREAAMPVYIGGAELNAAAALATWEVPVRYCTALPDHYLSREICTELGKRHIATDAIVFAGNRIGAYYLPQGADLKNTGVIYDRAHSSFSELQTGQLDWERLLEGCSWFHFSAISPALNEQVVAVCKEGLEAAQRKGLTISVDLNYRAKLWQYGKQPAEVMPELVAHCDVVMGNVWAKEKMLGIPVTEELPHEKTAYLKQSEYSSTEILRRFPKCRQVANTFRFDDQKGVHYYATLYTGGRLHVSREHRTDHIIDKVGSGDCFMAGLIYGNYAGLSAQETIEFAAAAAFNKLFIKGDATTSTIAEIKKGYLDYA